MATIKSDSIFISGLDTNIGEDEIRSEIFRPPQFSLLAITINYNRDGKSTGTATVRFASPTQAADAQREYNGAMVDGKPMSVQLIGTPVQPKVIIKAPQPAPLPQVIPQAQPAPKQPMNITKIPRQQNPYPQQQQYIPQQQQYIPQQQYPSQPRRAPYIPQQQQYIPQQTRRMAPSAAPRQQQPRGASRPVITARQPQRQTSRPAAAPAAKKAPAAPVAKKAPAPLKKTAPVAKKAAAPAKAAPAAKKAPVAKKAVAPKKVVKKPIKKTYTAAELDAQLDSYNAKRNSD